MNTSEEQIKAFIGNELLSFSSEEELISALQLDEKEQEEQLKREDNDDGKR